MEGSRTLQVPEIVIGASVKLTDLPDEWFVSLSNDLPSRQGFLFLTREGFEANKASLKEAYEKAGGVWSDFEKAAEADFSNRRQVASKKIAQLSKKIAELESYYRSI